jgi:predicted nucleic acid-binding protein
VKRERVLFDTSVLVAAMTEKHAAHGRALPWLKRALAGEIVFVVAAHSIAELYAVLTTLPGTPRISPAAAARLIRENVESNAEITSLGAADYSALARRFSELGLAGGAIYDGLIARAAQKSRADRLLTFNDRDFLRVWPEVAGILTVP